MILRPLFKLAIEIHLFSGVAIATKIHTNHNSATGTGCLECYVDKESGIWAAEEVGHDQLVMFDMSRK